MNSLSISAVRRCPTCEQVLPFDHDGVIINSDERTVMIGECSVRFPRTEFNVLALLWRHRPTIVSRQRIWDVLYSHREDGGPDPKIIDVWIARLRAALDGTRLHVETAYAEGYRLRIKNTTFKRSLHRFYVRDTKTQAKGPREG